MAPGWLTQIHRHPYITFLWTVKVMHRRRRAVPPPESARRHGAARFRHPEALGLADRNSSMRCCCKQIDALIAQVGPEQQRRLQACNFASTVSAVSPRTIWTAASALPI